MKKIIKQLITLLLMAFSFSGCSRENAKETTTDTELEWRSVSRTELPHDQNAYPVWTNAMLFAKPPSDKDDLRNAFRAASGLKSNLAEYAGSRLSKGKPYSGLLRSNMTKVADCPILLEWLDSRKDVLAEIDKGLALGKVQYPSMALSNATDNLHLSGFLALVELKKVNGRHLAECGNYSGAIDQFSDIYKMADMIANSDGAVMTCVMRHALTESGYLESLHWLSNRYQADTSALREILRRISVPNSIDPQLAQACQTEASLFSPHALKQLAKEQSYGGKRLPVRLTSVFDPLDTSRLARALFARFGTNACTTWLERDRNITDELNKRLKIADMPDKVKDTFFMDLGLASHPSQSEEATKLWKILKNCGQREPNIFGLLLLEPTISLTESTHRRSLTMRCRINLLRAAIALMIIKAETGSYPDTIDEAVKKGALSEVPIDFFSGKPLLYSSERHCLWSIGGDEVDHGGDKKTDIIFQLP